MEEKRNITSGDKIPGCERLTRPEEIKGLSKYLGAIRRTQEKWISENMPDAPLEEPIEDKVSELPDGKETIDITSPEHLPEDLIKIDPSEISLKAGKIKLRAPEDPKLPKGSEGLSVAEIEELPKEVVGLDIPKDRLKTGVERLIVDENINLPTDSVRISDDRKERLPKDLYRIHPEEITLGQKKERLVVKEAETLPEDVIGLGVNEPDSLPGGNLTIAIIHPGELPKDKEDIYPEEPKSLGNYLDRITIKGPDDLRQKKLDLDITFPDSLPDKREKISIKDLDSLPGDRLGLNIGEDPELPKTRLDISPGEPDLPKTRLDINPKDPDLPKGNIKINPAEIKSLPNTALGLIKEDISGLPKDNLFLEVTNSSRLDDLIKSMSSDELYDEVIKLLEWQRRGEGSGNLELAGIISAYLGPGGDSSEGRIKEAAGKIASILEKQRKLLNNIEDPEIIQEKKDLPGGSRRKNIESRELYQDSGKIKMPEYRTPQGEDPTKDLSNLLNPAFYDQDRYIRRLAEIAANATSGDGQLSASLRNQVLQQTLRALFWARLATERETGMARDRLPGGSIVKQGLQELVRGGIISRIGNSIESELKKIYTISKNSILNPDSHRLPENRPSKDSNGNVEMANSEEVFNNTFFKDGLRKDSALESISDRINETKKNIAKEKSNLRNLRFNIFDIENTNSSSKILSGLKEGFSNEADKVENQLNQEYAKLEKLAEAQDYINSEGSSGIALTLHDLCPNTDPKGISKMEDLKKALVESPYITTPWKLIKPGNNATLDNNAYWELIIQPYLEVNENGGYSFLPSIKEINFENMVQHGHNTLYSKWIPISNFELQKSKLVSKSLGLFDGEISYPVSVEYTNELRITVVDDQYKSWRRYFQRCADVSIFFSEAHKEDYYKEKESVILPTAIDKSKICAAYYKNIAFNIKIYCMTPQYSTIRKFDLLCVMKDFGDEWMGEIEGGGQDLSISFSVVGENPPTNMLDIEKTALQKQQEKEAKESQEKLNETFRQYEEDSLRHTAPARIIGENETLDEKLNANIRESYREMDRMMDDLLEEENKRLADLAAEENKAYLDELLKNL